MNVEVLGTDEFQAWFLDLSQRCLLDAIPHF
jgi:hypothetical protein